MIEKVCELAESIHTSVKSLSEMIALELSKENPNKELLRQMRKLSVTVSTASDQVVALAATFVGKN